MPSGASVTIEGLDQVLAGIKGLSADLRTMANRELRAAARDIARSTAARLPSLAGGAAQADAVARSARPKSDRMPIVRIPGVKVPVSGVRRQGGKGEAVAWGATGGGVAPQFAGTRQWVNDSRQQLTDWALPPYRAALAAMIARYGL